MANSSAVHSGQAVRAAWTNERWENSTGERCEGAAGGERPGHQPVPGEVQGHRAGIGQRGLGRRRHPKDVNVAAAVDESGRTIGGDQPASISASTTPEGNSDLLAWARGLGDTVVAFAVEGTGSYGASLTRFLQRKGQIVVEATRPKREDKAVRRTLGKSDAIDALLAAQRLHRLELRISPKSRVGDVECLRMLRVARKTAVKARTQAINSMKA